MSRSFRPEAIRPPRDFAPEVVREFVSRATPGKLDLEIGCGVGWHPIQYSAEHPDRFLIAIERTSEKFERFRGRYSRHVEPANLLPVHADALAFVAHAFPEAKETFSRVFLLYPNPSPKNPAQRWIRMPFFGFLLERVELGGEILFASNEITYLEEVRDFAPEEGVPSVKVGEIREVPPSRSPRTHFEKKYLERGERCWELSLRRTR